MKTYDLEKTVFSELIFYSIQNDEDPIINSGTNIHIMIYGTA